MSKRARRLRPVVVLRPEECVGCAVCDDLCEPEALLLGAEDLLPVWLSELCTGCSVCERQCPFGAITVEWVPNAASRPPVNSPICPAKNSPRPGEI
jgi:Na+-translocating ferredoxin:NAD+ oxidoreductase RNF subunit RnfB